MNMKQWKWDSYGPTYGSLMSWCHGVSCLTVGGRIEAPEALSSGD